MTYWWLNLRPGAEAFFNYFGVFFLDLLVAESLVVTLSSLCPIFVAILSLSALINGLWMTVGGFLISPDILNAFWKYTFYQIDYQRFTFMALVRNQMIGTVYTCGPDCHCEFVTSLANDCLIEGSELVDQLGYTTSKKMCYVCFQPFKTESPRLSCLHLLLECVSSLGFSYIFGGHSQNSVICSTISPGHPNHVNRQPCHGLSSQPKAGADFPVHRSIVIAGVITLVLVSGRI